jgi:hypothetical protein
MKIAGGAGVFELFDPAMVLSAGAREQLKTMINNLGF